MACPLLWAAMIKPLSWDVTVVCALADSHVAAAAREAGSAAETAAARKSAKYTRDGHDIPASRHRFTETD